MLLVVCVSLCLLQAKIAPAAAAPPPAGPPGENGATGFQGDTGDTGADAGDGTPGTKGVDGLPGSVGEQGDTGDTGPSGPPGVIGNPGSNGVVGPTGSDGNDGTPGTNGATGQPGVQGDRGSAGPDASDGTNGQDGAGGDTGATGDQGEKGTKGDPGDDGVSRAQGGLGDPGQQGYTGDQGPQGPQGVVGPPGDTGPIGPEGIQGVPGILPDWQDECLEGPTECDDDPIGLAICIDMKFSHYCKCRIADTYGVEWNPDTNACEFPPGEELTNNCEIDNGGCSHNCTAGETFYDYTCSCDEGFVLSANEHTCRDIDECLGDHGCMEQCVNRYGTYECTCPHGYDAVGRQCQDYDECQEQNGGCSNDCHNTMGSYNCACPVDYMLDDDGHTCVSDDQTVVTIPADAQWQASHGQSDHPQTMRMASDVLVQIDECKKSTIRCKVIFREGSLVTVIIMQPTTLPLSDDAKLALSQSVVHSLTGDNGTVTILGQQLPVAGEITGSGGDIDWVLTSPCDVYDDIDFCLEGSHCEVIDGLATCICQSEYMGEQCDVPGIGYDSAPDLTRPDMAQIIGSAVSIMFSVVATVVGGYVLCSG